MFAQVLSHFSGPKPLNMLWTDFRLCCSRTISRAISWRWLGKPTTTESMLIESLRSGLRQVSLPQQGSSEAEEQWNQRRIALRNLVLTEDPRRMLKWDIWRSFCGQCGYAHLRELQISPDWNDYWKSALGEPSLGQPLRCPRWPSTSSYRIFQAYVLFELHNMSQKRVANFPVIVEFGGGYGALAALAFSLGFHGTYVIFDLPEFRLLQRYYLKSLGLRVGEGVEPAGSAFGSSPSVVLVGDVGELNRLLGKLPGASLFVSVRGLTDTSLEFRQLFLPLLRGFQALFFLYQPQFREVDNVQWKEQMVRSLGPFEWLERQPPMLRPNRLLLGTRRLASP